MLCNNKGGAGKTTICVNLAHALALKGKKVLVVDLDHQNHVAECFGLDEANHLERLLFKLDPIEELITPVTGYKFDIILNEFDFWQLMSIMKLDNNLLEKRLSNSEELKYDYILMDSGPQMSILVAWAMDFCDWMIVPAKPQFLNMVGLKNIRRMARTFGKGDDSILGVIPTMANPRTREFAACKVLAEEVLGIGKFGPVVRQYSDFSKSQFKSKTIFDYAPSSKAAQDMKNVTEWVLKRIREEARRIGKEKRSS